MVSAIIFVESGAKGKAARNRVREGFGKLFKKCDFGRRLPAVVPSGSRNDAFDNFKNALEKNPSQIAFLLVDSEDPIIDVERTWQHLKVRDGWDAPEGATDEHVLLMTTCMETWFVADRETLRTYYQTCLSEGKLPADTDREQRHRHDLLRALEAATKDCSSPYGKGDRSFDLVAELDPKRLMSRLPNFARIIRILTSNL